MIDRGERGPVSRNDTTHAVGDPIARERLPAEGSGGAGLSQGHQPVKAGGIIDRSLC